MNCLLHAGAPSRDTGAATAAIEQDWKLDTTIEDARAFVK
jgi:hypothetical protein